MNSIKMTDNDTSISTKVSMFFNVFFDFLLLKLQYFFCITPDAFASSSTCPCIHPPSSRTDQPLHVPTPHSIPSGPGLQPPPRAVFRAVLFFRWVGAAADGGGGHCGPLQLCGCVFHDDDGGAAGVGHEHAADAIQGGLR